MSARSRHVICAMSGGVDSSVAARLLLEAGCRVTGVFLCLHSAGDRGGSSRSCCTPGDAADARRVAGRLGIDLHVLDVAGEFEAIIDDFAAEYAAGRTPNPCVHCNARIKFGRLVRLADALEADGVATGHHARVGASHGGPAILRGRHRAKDQSYALFAVPRGTLPRVLLPVGEIDDKRQVRRIAAEMGLDVHDKPDSQEICFAPDDDYTAVLARRAPHALRGGDIVISSGEVLGRHGGYARYTIGQRRGLGVSAPVPLYVTAIDAATATVTVGPKAEVLSRRLAAAGANWHADVPEAFDAVVQVRYNHAGTPGRVRITAADRFEVDFHEDVSAVTPGQAAVVYADHRLLGGGWIS